jgi:hypothetical protein
MAYQSLTIEHFYKSKEVGARFVDACQKLWGKVPLTCALTTIIGPERSGGCSVTFVIEWSSEDTETQNYLDLVRTTLQDALPAGLSRWYDEDENVEER